jgi:hypothetical protein
MSSNFSFSEYYHDRNANNDLLFHYTSYKTAIEHILWCCNLKFSTCRNSHDPFEKENLFYKSNIDISPSFMSYSHMMECERTFQKILYACFCIDKNSLADNLWNKGCFRSRMWSQYSDAHSGVCFVLSKSEIFGALKNKLNHGSVGWVVGNPIIYSNSKEIEFRKNDIEYVLKEDNAKSFAEKYLFHKVRDYADETEYRICFEDLKGLEISNLFIKSAIKGLILGCNFPEAYIGLIRELSNKIPIESVKINWEEVNPRLFGI